jgi:hypothetical protein
MRKSESYGMLISVKYSSIEDAEKKTSHRALEIEDLMEI